VPGAVGTSGSYVAERPFGNPPYHTPRAPTTSPPSCATVHRGGFVERPSPHQRGIAWASTSRSASSSR
jgi:hypothetical protein